MRTWVDGRKNHAVVFVLIGELHGDCEPHIRGSAASSGFDMHAHTITANQPLGRLSGTGRGPCVRVRWRLSACCDDGSTKRWLYMLRLAQRLRAAFEARYDGSITSRGPSGAAAFFAAAEIGLTDASLELMTATTLRPPSFACAQFKRPVKGGPLEVSSQRHKHNRGSAHRIIRLLLSSAAVPDVT